MNACIFLYVSIHASCILCIERCYVIYPIFSILTGMTMFKASSVTRTMVVLGQCVMVPLLMGVCKYHESGLVPTMMVLSNFLVCV